LKIKNLHANIPTSEYHLNSLKRLEQEIWTMVVANRSRLQHQKFYSESPPNYSIFPNIEHASPIINKYLPANAFFSAE